MLLDVPVLLRMLVYMRMQAGVAMHVAMHMAIAGTMAMAAMPAMCGGVALAVTLCVGGFFMSFLAGLCSLSALRLSRRGVLGFHSLIGFGLRRCLRRTVLDVTGPRHGLDRSRAFGLSRHIRFSRLRGGRGCGATGAFRTVRLLLGIRLVLPGGFSAVSRDGLNFGFDRRSSCIFGGEAATCNGKHRGEANEGNN